MPTDNEKKTAAPAAAAVDPRDQEIKDLKLEVTALKDEKAKLEAKLKAKPAPAPTTPSGDYCVLGGKTYQVAGTVMTRFASEEGRKNNTEDEDLVILKR